MTEPNVPKAAKPRPGMTPLERKLFEENFREDEELLRRLAKL